MKPTERQLEYVERVGRWWETLSGSRIAGRILGWLMICEPPHQSSQELAEALQSSAGSISTQARVLEGIGFLDRVTFAGDRATYYQLKPNVWYELMWGEYERIKEMKMLAVAASDVIPETRPDRVIDIGRIGDFFSDEWPSLMERLAEHMKRETND